MAGSDFWGEWGTQQRQDAAMSFLTSGSNKYNRLRISGSNSQGCLDSSDCASGWACNSGICRQSDTGAGSRSYGDSTGCGSGTDGRSGGGGGSDCGAGTDESTFTGDRDSSDASQSGKCLKTGCGGYRKRPNKGPDPCCGKGRCCRFGYNYVQCYCGNCPDRKKACSKWCTDYLAANGEKGEGCSNSNSCSECETCSQNSSGKNRCQPKDGAACHCEGSSCTGEGESCKDGLCLKDCKNSQRCYTASKECSCGTIYKKCCQPACSVVGRYHSQKGYTECRESIDCRKECGEADEDLCKGVCTGTTWCEGDQPEPPCPAKSTCTDNGFITVGEKTCHIRTDCDKSKVSDSCGKCDCNCNNDCSTCQLCGADGKCYPDPACSGLHYVVKGFFQYYVGIASSPRFDPACYYSCQIRTSTVVAISGILGDENDLGPSVSWKEGSTVGPLSMSSCTCDPKNGCIDNGYYTTEIGYRSNGTTPARPAFNRGFRRYPFTGKFSRGQNYSNSVATYEPLGLHMFIGVGETAPEAAADLARQTVSIDPRNPDHPSGSSVEDLDC